MNDLNTFRELMTPSHDGSVCSGLKGTKERSIRNSRSKLRTMLLFMKEACAFVVLGTLHLLPS